MHARACPGTIRRNRCTCLRLYACVREHAGALMGHQPVKHDHVAAASAREPENRVSSRFYSIQTLHTFRSCFSYLDAARRARRSPGPVPASRAGAARSVLATVAAHGRPRAVMTFVVGSPFLLVHNLI